MSVVAKLRDAGVLVTSSASGYKLPTCPKDLDAFVRHAETVCIPMLHRVKAACDAVKLATAGDIDVLARPDWSAVQKLVATLDDKGPSPRPTTAWPRGSRTGSAASSSGT